MTPAAPGSVRLSPPSKDVTPLRPDHVSPGHVSRSSPVTELQARVTTVRRADTKLGERGDLTDLARGAEVVQVPGTEVRPDIIRIRRTKQLLIGRSVSTLPPRLARFSGF